MTNERVNDPTPSEGNQATQETLIDPAKSYTRPDLKRVTAEAIEKAEKKSRRRKRERSQVDIEAYWLERKTYLEKIQRIPEMKTRYFKAMIIYLLRRFLWSFGFFPVFLAIWIPLILNRFNPVATVSNLLPHLEKFVLSNPEAQAATMQTIWLAWFSIGFIFAIFDFVLTPYKSPYEYEADVHMRAWEQLQKANKS